MKRREFITVIGAVIVWPFTTRAQQPVKVPEIGYLDLGPASARTLQVEAFRAGLRDLGYVEGKNIVIEFRWAERVDQMPALAAELVRMNVDVIFAIASTQVEPARQATKTIPIVFASHADPIGTGHVASLSRPGGNVTGLSMLLTPIVTKELELLKEGVPTATRIGILWNPTAPSHTAALKAIGTAAEKLRVELLILPVRAVEDFEGVFSTMTRERVDAFLVVQSPLTTSYRTPLAEIALRHRLPGMFGNKAAVEAGGLMSYGADGIDLMRRAAGYVDKILRGAKPADLPVEQASKFELVINLKTAKGLGLIVPLSLLARADEVIE